MNAKAETMTNYRLCTVIFDRCDDGLNWHVMAPEGHLMDSYRSKGEAMMVAEERNQDELSAMENEVAHITDPVAREDAYAALKRWNMRRTPVTESRWS